MASDSHEEHSLIMIWFIVLNATFSNISAISWRPVLVVEEDGVPGESHLWLPVECTLFFNLQSRARTHSILVISLYELLGNPTTQLIAPPGSYKNYEITQKFIYHMHI